MGNDKTTPNLDIQAAAPPQVTWEAPEFTYHQKGKGWYTTIVLAGLALGGLFFFLGQYLAVAVVVLGAIVFWRQGATEPKNIRLTLNEDGLTRDNKLYPFGELKSFWIMVGPEEEGVLYLETTRKWNHILTILLGTQNPAMVRNFLLQYLPEQPEGTEDFADRIGRIMRF